MITPRGQKENAMSENLWGPVRGDEWWLLPCVSGRIAREEDVLAGRAVFFLSNAAQIKARPMPIRLPACALLTDQERPEKSAVIVIQAEQAGNATYIGYRDLQGGNGVCTLSEITLLDKPGDGFFPNG
jgi:hypothetical protein